VYLPDPRDSSAAAVVKSEGEADEVPKHRYLGPPPTNDMWLAVAKLLDVPLTTLGTPQMHTTPLYI
jgi:hypothetical protein